MPQIGWKKGEKNLACAPIVARNEMNGKSPPWGPPLETLGGEKGIGESL